MVSAQKATFLPYCPQHVSSTELIQSVLFNLQNGKTESLTLKEQSSNSGPQETSIIIC